MSAAILTVTPNPAIDVSATTQTVTFEHKLRCTDVRRDPGGGGINVARVLTRFGARCTAVYPGGPILGRLLRDLLEREGVPSIALEIAGETRESFTVLERASGREYRFVLPGPRLEPGEWQACIDLVDRHAGPLAYVVGSGSLPEGAPEDFFARLARAARQRGARMVLDTSGAPLAAALREGVYLVKPNLRELRELTGEALESEDDWSRAAQALVPEPARVRAAGSDRQHGGRGRQLRRRDAVASSLRWFARAGAGPRRCRRHRGPARAGHAARVPGRHRAARAPGRRALAACRLMRRPAAWFSRPRTVFGGREPPIYGCPAPSPAARC